MDDGTRPATFDARNSQGLVYQPSGPVSQFYGATPDQILEALEKAGTLALIRTRVPEEQFRALLEIVGRVTLADLGAQVHRACSASLLPTAHLVNADIPTLLLADMCQQPIINDWPPIIECVERLALVDGVEAVLAGELQGWTDANFDQLTPPTTTEHVQELRLKLRAEAAKATTEAALSWLQVQLASDPMNRTEGRKQPLFRVEVVLSSPLTDGPLVLTPESDRTLDDLPALLDEVFAQPENVALIPALERLVIEIVAPTDVLLYGFERWKRGDSTFTYGIEYPLVVRMRDRLAIPNPANQKRADEYWHGKWNAFRNKVCLLGNDGLVWREARDLDVITLQDEAGLACLGLRSPIVPGTRDVFDTLRDAGIPVALLVRGSDLGPSAPSDLPGQFSPLIEGRRLWDLHEAIRLGRRSPQARADPTHVYNATTLLWDDPERAPLKYAAEGAFA